MDPTPLRTDEIDALFDEWLDASLSEERETEVENLLRSSGYGRQLLQMQEQFRASGAESATADVTGLVANDLPEGSPRLYLAVAELVVRAWGDPVLRERLRAAPREVLNGEGIFVPEAIQIGIVTVDEARLPSSTTLHLPLPERGSPAISSRSTLQRLRASEFAWFWGIPGTSQSRACAEQRSSPDSLARRVGAWWQRVTNLPSPSMKLAYAAVAVGVVAIAVVFAGARPTAEGLTGRADAQSAGLVVLVGVVAAGLVALALRGRG